MYREALRNCKEELCNSENGRIAHVEVNGAVETVHVKNTGRCRELLLPGTAVRLEVSDNPKRKQKIRPCGGYTSRASAGSTWTVRHPTRW